VAAGPVALAPEAAGTPLPAADLGRLGIGTVSSVYRATTPAGEPFAFDVLTRSGNNGGTARVALAHAADGGATPSGGLDSLAAAGCVATGRGLTGGVEWLDARGDGFAAITVRGAITSDQVLAFRTTTAEGTTTALVCLDIGPPSSINDAAPLPPDYPGVLDDLVLYSSDSWAFGLPAIAVSGDRTSIVTYEGDRADPYGVGRYEMRLQHDALTGAVTGGGSVETGPDSGYWRDHELAALFNVLAVAHSGTDAVTVRLSFDRGATFGQVHAVPTAGNGYAARLIQTAMAADYTLAVLFWRATGGASSDLMLVEGRPSQFDLGGSPTQYAFTPPQVVLRVAGDVTPLVLGAAWSSGGDLVVGHAYTTFTSGEDRTWRSVTQFRCAVRPFGGTFTDRLVEEDVVVGRDPSVALLGSGPTMRIFYAYEARDGIRLRTSLDAGATFSPPEVIGAPGAYLPTVFAREGGGVTRVDVLHLATTEGGTELHLRHWADFAAALPTDHRLTRAAMQWLPAGTGTSPGDGLLPPGDGFRITEVGWFGYDAVLDGDEIVIAIDEVSYEAYWAFLGPPIAVGFLDGVPVAAAEFAPAEPPVLAPGMTDPVPLPDPAHMHQLRLLRLE
jgi:hypothetical protein